MRDRDRGAERTVRTDGTDTDRQLLKLIAFCFGTKVLKFFPALMRMREEVEGLSTAERKHSKEEKIANLDLSGVVKLG